MIKNTLIIKIVSNTKFNIITRYQFSTKPAVPDLNLARFGRRSSLAAFNLGLRLVFK